jgi:hypothetical protein
MRRSNRNIVVLILITSTVLSHSQIRQTATHSTCSNIVALTGSKVNCSNLTPAQEKEIARTATLVRKIFEKEIDPSKLDELIAKVTSLVESFQQPTMNIAPNGFAISGGTVINPTINNNTATRHYFCEGKAIINDPNKGSLMSITHDDGFYGDYVSMAKLDEAHNYTELLSFCTKLGISHPEWPTSILACAEANRGLANFEQAAADLREYQSKKDLLADASHPDSCDETEDALKGMLSLFITPDPGPATNSNVGNAPEKIFRPSALRFLNSLPMEFDSDKQAVIPLNFVTTGDQTIRALGLYHSETYGPSLTAAEERKKETEFWQLFDSYEAMHPSTVPLSAIPNSTATLEVQLGPDLSHEMSNLIAAKSEILVGVRLRDPESRKIIEETCIWFAPETSITHLCLGHNIP